jgi:hypothetical protein
MKPRRECEHCGKPCKRSELIQWMEEAGELSPKFCRKCYYYLVDHWEEGMDVGSEPITDGD